MHLGTVYASGNPLDPSDLLSSGGFKLIPGFGATVAIILTEHQKEAELLEEEVATPLRESQVLRADFRKHSRKH